MKQTIAVSREQYLSKEQTVVLKGLLALGVLLAHTVPASGLVSDDVLGQLIGALGYLCVAGFFFLSGYGIMAQYQAKKTQYLKDFLKNRVLSIYLLTLFLIVFYGIFRKILDIPISTTDLLQSFLVGNTIVSNGWYLQIVVVFYILWYLTTRYIQKEQLQFVLQCVAICVYICLGILMLDSFWYQSSLGFLLGIFWQKNKEKIDSGLFLCKKCVFAAFAIALLGFCVTFLLSSRNIISKIDTLSASVLPFPAGICNTVFNRSVRQVMSCLSALLFVVVFLVFNVIFGKLLNNVVFRFIGKLSIEVYVLQGIPLHLFANTALRIENAWLYIASVIAVTMLLSVAMHPVIQFVTNIPKKYLQRG